MNSEKATTRIVNWTSFMINKTHVIFQQKNALPMLSRKKNKTELQALYRYECFDEIVRLIYAKILSGGRVRVYE